MVHVAGDTGAIAWANSVDSSMTTEMATARANEANASFLTTGTLPAARLPGVVPAAIAVAVATSTTVETVMLAAPIPANSVAVGSTFRIILFGVTAASGNPSFSVRVGGAGTIADTLAATIGPITHTVAAGGNAEFLATFRAVGASGSVMVNGTAQMGVVATAQTAAAPATVTVDTTAARYITLTATMSASTFTAHTAVTAAVKA